MKRRNIIFHLLRPLATAPAVAALIMALVPALHAATLIVTNTADTGPGSLRTTLASAASGDIITFTNTLSGQTILLTNGLITLANTVTIDASSLSGGIRINGYTNSGIFRANAGTVVLNALALTITNGSAYGVYRPAGSGTLTLNQCSLSGTAFNVIFNDGTLTLNQCTVSGVVGLGIFNRSGTMAVNQCTLFGNSGGGILNDAALTVNQSTVSGNTGNGIYNRSGTLTLSNSIVAGNSGQNLLGSFASSGANLTNGTPLLASLGNYGGPTQTMPPLPGSPAIDGCTNGTGFTTDQRGYPRIAGPYADIGAVEAGDAIPGLNYTVVTTTNDFLNGLTSSGVSLRSAVAFVTNNANITFDPSLSGQTITLTNGQITLSNTVTLDASSLPGGIQINGSANERIFYVASNSTVVLDSLTITNGKVTVSVPLGQAGGGIYSSGTLTMNECILSGNSATGPGGGIYMFAGSVTMNECTLSGNTASGNSGGGISNPSGTLTLNQCTLAGNNSGANGGGISSFSGTVAVNQCTLSGNSAATAGGGIYQNAGSLTVYNSIVAGNSGNDITGAGTFIGVNLTNGTPLLAPLGNYGGHTPTMPPLPGSPAINAATNGTSFTTDQRGLPRIVGTFADLGAVEGVFNPAMTLTNITKLGNGSFQFGFANLSGPSYRVLASTNVAAPLNTWSDLGVPLEATAGVFQFTDPQATNYPQRFYRVRSP